jgi:signal transduction histidine kinase
MGMRIHQSKVFKYNYLKFLYLATTSIFTLNILRYNLQYDLEPKFTLLNSLLITPLFFLYLLPLFQNYFQAFNKTIIFYYIFTTFEVALNVSITGGLDSPALYWLAFMPTAAALLFGSQGVLLGISSLLLYGSIIYLMEFYNFDLSIIKNKEDYLFEKYFNAILLFSSVSILAYISVRGIEESKKNLTSQKNKVATLLRILLHDISNPLVVLRHFAKKLKGDHDQQLLDRMESKVEELVQILDHTKKIYLLDSQKGNVALEDVDLIAVMNDSIKSAKEYAEYKKCRVLFSHLTPTAFVKGFSVVFKNEIFDNILTNAIKFSDQRGIIEVKVLEEGDFYEIHIKDRGIGMPSDLLAKVFSFDRPTTRIGTQGEIGTGFGLPIVKEIVEQFYGYITVESRERSEGVKESGTCVKLTFPKADIK